MKAASDQLGRVLTPEDLQQLFLRNYKVLGRDDYVCKHSATSTTDGDIDVRATIVDDGIFRYTDGKGPSVSAALSNALAVRTGLQISFEVYHYKWVENEQEQDMKIAMCNLNQGKFTSWGAKLGSTLDAELLACLSALPVGTYFDHCRS
ncbi:hypothetical protein A1F94_010021 [Pyrenophora tritici-repentis]|uniref:Uncharacterized protein n=1 Tax=Pyrenophora tritici-repentis TaxID=45151 RepID=A0A316ZXX7_9PLEO|nr:hypothetical protein A1F99_120020 [Pyrenophora tritici-repentis]KAG9379665.1 hypothetical protein A1F94_010021 [Pyrenophora tritici-repentis]KAI1519304.1 hypothetical protein Ptr86124_002432 [Pyrenophora tritici-repentis]KAI1679243.1 hypothetical protein KJE20_11425 [Pyrenophora tritici-repentis]